MVMGMTQLKDTIPRLHQLVPHMRDQLIGLRQGATFEEVRRRFIATVDQLVADGLGRRTLSRVDDLDAYWSPAVGLLEEAIRLGFVQHQPLPSARRYLDGYREKRFELTDTGLEIADAAHRDLGRFFDLVASAIINTHPYFERFVLLLKEAPLICPEVSEGDIVTGRREGRGTQYWAECAAERINRGPREVVSAQDVKREISIFLQRRFGKSPAEKPPNKALSEAMNDAFATVSVKARGLPIGATELKILRAWGSQLRLLDQSRHVPAFQGSNLLWIAADLETAKGRIDASRRTFKEHGLAVAQAVVAAYRSQAAANDSSLAAPYLSIYAVRAEAAFTCGVTRALVDIVLGRMANGTFPELGVQVWLHLGRGDQPPPSEPVFRQGGSRRYQITITNQKEIAT